MPARAASKTGKSINRRVEARERAGLTRQQAAKRLEISEGYLRNIESRGGCTYVMARHMARLYKCSMMLFI